MLPNEEVSWILIRCLDVRLGEARKLRKLPVAI